MAIRWHRESLAILPIRDQPFDRPRPQWNNPWEERVASRFSDRHSDSRAFLLYLRRSRSPAARSAPTPRRTPLPPSKGEIRISRLVLSVPCPWIRPCSRLLSTGVWWRPAPGRTPESERDRRSAPRGQTHPFS